LHLVNLITLLRVWTGNFVLSLAVGQTSCFIVLTWWCHQELFKYLYLGGLHGEMCPD